MKISEAIKLIIVEQEEELQHLILTIAGENLWTRTVIFTTQT